MEDIRKSVRPYLILISSVVMQMCLGATYSWSAYVQPLREITGLLQGPVQLPFTLFYFAFPATMLAAGGILSRKGPRWCAATGGLIFGSGWLIAGLGIFHFSFTVLGIGLIAGMGAGLAYMVPIATCIQWFPRHKGLVTGIAVAGFGGGAALVTQTAGYLMNTYHLTPFAAFVALGATFLILVSGAGLYMQPPPDAATSENKVLPLPLIIRHPAFRLLYLAMFAGLCAGFTVNANLRELFGGASPQTGISAVAFFALANAAGRIIWGFICDRSAPVRAILANLLLQALLLLAAPFILTSDTGLIAFALTAGFNYGGVLVLYAANVAHLWGAHAVGQVYGRLFSANIPAAVAPVLAATAFDLWGDFNRPLAVIGGGIIIAALLTFRYRSSLDDRHSRPDDTDREPL